MSALTMQASRTGNVVNGLEESLALPLLKQPPARLVGAFALMTNASGEIMLNAIQLLALLIPTLVKQFLAAARLHTIAGVIPAQIGGNTLSAISKKIAALSFVFFAGGMLTVVNPRWAARAYDWTGLQRHPELSFSEQALLKAQRLARRVANELRRHPFIAVGLSTAAMALGFAAFYRTGSSIHQKKADVTSASPTPVNPPSLSVTPAPPVIRQEAQVFSTSEAAKPTPTPTVQTAFSDLKASLKSSVVPTPTEKGNPPTEEEASLSIQQTPSGPIAPPSPLSPYNPTLASALFANIDHEIVIRNKDTQQAHIMTHEEKKLMHWFYEKWEQWTVFWDYWYNFTLYGVPPKIIVLTTVSALVGPSWLMNRINRRLELKAGLLSLQKKNADGAFLFRSWAVETMVPKDDQQPNVDQAPYCYLTRWQKLKVQLRIFREIAKDWLDAAQTIPAKIQASLEAASK